MTVKKIIISNLSSDTTFWGCSLQLFDKNGNYIDTGIVMGTPTLTRSNMENCIITSNKDVYSATGNYSLSRLMQNPRATGGAGYTLGANKPTSITIEWNKEIEISKINYVLKNSGAYTSKAGVKFSAYDNNDVLIKEYNLNQMADIVTGGLDLLTPELIKPLFKTFIKSQNNIHILSKEKDSLVYPKLVEPLTQADYEKWGMDSLVGYEDEVDKVLIEMNKSGELEDGKVLRNIINKNKFKINSISIK